MIFQALIVEDDVEIAKITASFLREESWQCAVAHTGSLGLNMALQGSYDLIILDCMLPDISGVEVVRKIRQASLMTPVLFLTALDGVQDRVRGLDAGADDYLTKPFDIPELLARIRALSRRKGSIVVKERLVYGPLTISQDSHDGIANGTLLQLTGKEYEILKYLLRNAEQILTREQLFVRVWGYDSDAGPSVVDVYVHRLRKKLAEHGCDRYIKTVRSIGYMLRE
ncbi:response regulator transcription factor [Alicyclobacillus tolerans]|uniref:response regulator transcription factor n=1 Tax=Alicyclobacillus tolerans TaxID=90970 RepID=UPI001F1EB885|nr:response regulator transcription factor [Alicyclobacillus tolerans]MCF8563227.1 response regulator transcription factor [Alicyclobacillus tolerans]